MHNDKTKMYRIVHEAYEFAKREGEGGRKNYGIDEAMMWDKTHQYYTGKEQSSMARSGSADQRLAIF